jgi:predicted membrane-bound spermidine synthase
MRGRADPLFALFFASGFSGLIYESVWSHYVKLFLGHAAYAQTLVLVVFIGGLALGSWLCSRWAAGIPNPLRAYAMIEGAIGVGALVFHPVFGALVDWGYGSLLPATCEQSSAFCASQWALSALMLAPQSILLGATFPLMSSAVIRLREAQPGHDIATLYFLNSLGAVLGVLASAFLLIPRIGLPGALETAGLANCVIALVAWLLSRRTDPPLPAAPEAGEVPRWDWSSPRLTRLLLWTAMLTGLSSFVYEIAWIRMLSLVLGASTHAFELMLAAFILGLALGGLWVRHRVDPSHDPVRFLGIVQLAMGVAAAATLAIYAGSFDLMAWLLGALNRNSGGFVFFNLGSTAIALLVMLPATFCAGMTLPLITYRLLRSPTGERALGMVYAVNTLGAILGVVVAVHLLLEWVGLKGAILVGAAIDVGLGVVLLAASAGNTGAKSWRALHLPAGLALVALLTLALAFDVDPRKSASGVFRSGTARIAPTDTILYHHDGKTATVDVVESRGARAIRTNGKADAAIGTGAAVAGDEYTMALLALLPLGHAPQAKTAAVIGFGSGMSTATLLGSPHLQRVDTIEIEPAMIEGARHFRPTVQAAYDDPRSRIVIDDAKSYFARGRERYDIIVSEPSNPWVSGVASLFTEEFYRRLHAYMNDGAVLSQWLHTYEMDAPTLASILRAVSRTFPEFAIYTTIDTDIVLIARKGGAPGAFDPAVLAHPGLKPIVGRLKLDAPGAVARRRVGHWKTLGPYFEGSYGVPANSDFFPIVESRASRTRYMRDTVTDLVNLLASPVPMLEMLDHGILPARERGEGSRVTVPEGATAAAWSVHDIIMRSGPSIATFTAPHEVSAQLVRQWAADCRPELSFMQVFGHLLALAETVNPGLHPEVSGALWRRLADSPCGRALDPPDRVWLELFAAVGARDPAAMRDKAARALEGQRNARGPAGEYALLAAVTAALKLGDAAQAQALLQEGERTWLRPGERRSEVGYLQNLVAARSRR